MVAGANEALACLLVGFYLYAIKNNLPLTARVNLAYAF